MCQFLLACPSLPLTFVTNSTSRICGITLSAQSFYNFHSGARTNILGSRHGCQPLVTLSRCEDQLSSTHTDTQAGLTRADTPVLWPTVGLGRSPRSHTVSLTTPKPCSHRGPAEVAPVESTISLMSGNVKQRRPSATHHAKSIFLAVRDH